MKNNIEIEKKMKKNMHDLEKIAKKKHTLSIDAANVIIARLGKTLLILIESSLFPLAYPISYLPEDKAIIQSAFGVIFNTTKVDSVDRHNLYMGYFSFLLFIDDAEAMKKNSKVIKMNGFLDQIGKKSSE